MTTDENDALYKRIRSGDKAAIDEMILGNLTLAENRLSLFLREWRRFEHLHDDLYGEAILALTETVNSFAVSAADKPTGCIVSAIDYALKNFVDAESGAGLMSRSVVQRRRSNGESLPQRLFDVAEPPASLWRNASGRIERKQLDSDADYDSFGRPSKIGHEDAEQFIAHFEQGGETDVRDQILACCESEQEQEIVRLRIDGYTDAEIGEQLGISRQTVNRRRHDIEDRFNERIEKARSE